MQMTFNAIKNEKVFTVIEYKTFFRTQKIKGKSSNFEHHKKIGKKLKDKPKGKKTEKKEVILRVKKNFFFFRTRPNGSET